MMKYKFDLTAILCMMLFLTLQSSAQPRIEFNNQQIFLSGANVPWVYFSSDIGPGTTNFNSFKTIFDSVHACGGNSMRLWLHTTGSVSPQFDATGKVIGPGVGAIDDLEQILDLAWEREIGLMLCLWSFDMLRISNGATITNRAMSMLTDTSYTNTYVRNSLIPMVEALEGHPGILSWEIFNEPEGMSEEYGWDMCYRVPMSNIQRFINLCAGAIHRTDSKAKVTNGSWCLIAQTDVTNLARGFSVDNYIQTLNIYEKEKIENEFFEKYNAHQSAESIIKNFYPASGNFNYYTDERLIAAGGDNDGYLDFYTVHYYDWAGTPLSPFHYSYEHWQLTKALAIGEFFMSDVFEIPYEELFVNLIENGYAGALPWAWNHDNQYQSRMKEVIRDLLYNYPGDVDINPVSGIIYALRATPDLIQAGDSALIEWYTSFGSSVTLNGEIVSGKGKLYVSPAATTTYTLIASGDVTDSAGVIVQIYPSGMILAFRAEPPEIGENESTILKWETSKGSIVKINDESVNEDGEMEVFPVAGNLYVLTTEGDVMETATVTVSILPADEVNRALFRDIIASSTAEDSGEPVNLVDGDLLTKWTSENANNQWVEMDFGKSISVERVALYWDAAYATAYRIGLSEDNISWQLLHLNNNATGGLNVIDNLSGTGRYFKLMLDKRATENGFSLKEIEVYGLPSSTSDVSDYSAIPCEFTLEQNYPNPFNPTTTIKFSIPIVETPYMASLRVTLQVYDVLGREITTLIDEEKPSGSYSFAFDASTLASGIYFYKLRAGSFSQCRKMILLK
ncbi:MAG: discoidin domain-containing protein [bacterium]